MEYDASRYVVPDGFETLLEGYVKEVIRFNPQDIAAFSRDYFTALADGSLQQTFEKKIKEHGYLKVQVDPKTEEYGSNNYLGRPAVPSGKETLLEKKTGAERGSLQPRTRARPLAGSTPAPDQNARKQEIYRAAFAKYDADNSGSIDMSELESLLTDIGWDSDGPALVEAKAYLDKDGNGELELEEFIKWTDYAWKTRVLQRGTSYPLRKSSAKLTRMASSFNEADEAALMEEEDEQSYI